MREKIACFTGHRPEKLASPFCEDAAEIGQLKHELQERILRAVDEGYTIFLCGMAQGVDIWAGEIVLSLQEQFHDLKLIAVLPFPEQTNGWPLSWKIRHRRLLRYCDRAVTICPQYQKGCFQQRNKYMVDHADRLIGIIRSGSRRSGTGQTVRYAQRQGLALDLVVLP